MNIDHKRRSLLADLDKNQKRGMELGLPLGQVTAPGDFNSTCVELQERGISYELYFTHFNNHFGALEAAHYRSEVAKQLKNNDEVSLGQAIKLSSCATTNFLKSRGAAMLVVCSVPVYLASWGCAYRISKLIGVESILATISISLVIHVSFLASITLIGYAIDYYKKHTLLNEPNTSYQHSVMGQTSSIEVMVENNTGLTLFSSTEPSMVMEETIGNCKLEVVVDDGEPKSENSIQPLLNQFSKLLSEDKDFENSLYASVAACAA